jgi:hypothetical protein
VDKTKKKKKEEGRRRRRKKEEGRRKKKQRRARQRQRELGSACAIEKESSGRGRGMASSSSTMAVLQSSSLAAPPQVLLPLRFAIATTRLQLHAVPVPSFRCSRRRRLPAAIAMSKPQSSSSSSSPPPPSSSSSSSIKDALQESIREAEEVCAAEGGSGECAAAWDTVEELSAAISHKRDGEASAESKDPLEKFCKDAPEADECRVYED